VVFHPTSSQASLNLAVRLLSGRRPSAGRVPHRADDRSALGARSPRAPGWPRTLSAHETRAPG